MRRLPLSELIADGYLKIEARYSEAKKGCQTSNLYTLLVPEKKEIVEELETEETNQNINDVVIDEPVEQAEQIDIKNVCFDNLHLKNRSLTVLMYLLERAGKKSYCFPGIKTIANVVKLSVSTVRRALSDLVEKGVIKKEARFLNIKKGGQTSNLYTVVTKVIAGITKIVKHEKGLELTTKEETRANEKCLNNNKEHKTVQSKATILHFLFHHFRVSSNKLNRGYYYSDTL